MGVSDCKKIIVVGNCESRKAGLSEDCPEFLRYDEVKRMWYYPRAERSRVLSYMTRFPREEMHTFYSLKAAHKWLDKLEEKIKADKEKHE